MPHRIESPFSFRLAEKITGVPGGTVPFRYGEARGIFSFEKRMSPPPPKEKRGGISISPRTPLKRHKGAKLRFLPFGNPSWEKETALPFGNPSWGWGAAAESEAEGVFFAPQ